MEYMKCKYSKQHMKQDPLTTAYLKVLNENASNGKVEGQSLEVGEPFGHSENKKNTETFYKDSGEEKVKKDVKKPTKAPAELSEEPENEPKEFKAAEKLTLKDSRNPFDALFNKIISEDSFDFSSHDGVEPEDNFGGPEGLGVHSTHDEDEDEEELSDDEQFGDDDDSEDYEEDEHEDLGLLVSQLKELVGKIESHLEAHAEHEEGEEGEDEFPEDSREDYGDEDEDEDEVSEEAVDAEVLGYPLVDQERLEKSHSKKANWNVKGAVPKTGTKAEVVKGKKVNGKPEDFKNAEGISKLQSKQFDAKGVKVGKFLFDDQRGE
jgi:hypothetical protein